MHRTHSKVFSEPVSLLAHLPPVKTPPHSNHGAPFAADGPDEVFGDRGLRFRCGPTVAAVVLGAAVRLWQTLSYAPSWWQDSTDYALAGSAGMWSTRLWLGPRPPLVPLLLSLTGREPGAGFVLLQVLVAAACWAVLAGEVASQVVASRWRRWLVAAAVVAFSLTTQITMWDRSVLTESLTLSGLALGCAFGLRALRTGRVGWLAGFVIAAACAVATRDSMAVMVAVVAVALAVGALGSCRNRRALLAVVSGLVIICAVAAMGATAGSRDAVPTANAMFVRVLPFPDRVQWFVDRGMPDGDFFLRASAAAPDSDTARIVAVGRDDPAFADWWDWVGDRGRAALWSFALTHPGYLLFEPAASPERTFNNADGDIGFYAAADMPTVALVSSLFWPDTTVTMVAGAATIAGWWALGRPRQPLWVVSALLAAGSCAYSFVAWHSDGMETARHIFIGAAGVRLALLLAVLAAGEQIRGNRALVNATAEPRPAQLPGTLCAPEACLHVRS